MRKDSILANYYYSKLPQQKPLDKYVTGGPGKGGGRGSVACPGPICGPGGGGGGLRLGEGLKNLFQGIGEGIGSLFGGIGTGKHRLKKRTRICDQYGMEYDPSTGQCVPREEYTQKTYTFGPWGASSKSGYNNTIEQGQNPSRLYEQSMMTPQSSFYNPPSMGGYSNDIVYNYTSPEGNLPGNLINNGQSVNGVPTGISDSSSSTASSSSGTGSSSSAKFGGLIKASDGKQLPKKPPVKHYVFAEDSKDQAFVTEANNLKSYIGKNYPGEEVVVIPGYGKEYFDKQVRPTLEKVGKQDRVYIFGHHGDMYAGVPNDVWGDTLEAAQKKSGNFDCYLGSCASGDIVAGDYNMSVPSFSRVSNMYYRPNMSWFGVNPNAVVYPGDSRKGVLEAMFSRANDPNAFKYASEYFKHRDKKIEELQSKSKEYNDLRKKLNDMAERSESENIDVNEAYNLNIQFDNLLEKFQQQAITDPEVMKFRKTYEKAFEPRIKKSLTYGTEYAKHDWHTPMVDLRGEYEKKQVPGIINEDKRDGLGWWSNRPNQNLELRQILSRYKNGGWLDKYAGGGPTEPYHPITNPTGYKMSLSDLEAVRKRNEEKATAAQIGPQIGQHNPLYDVQRKRYAEEALRKKAQENSALAQTMGLFTPSGSNPAAGAIGAETFVNMNPLVSGPIMSTSRLYGAGRSMIDPKTFNPYFSSDKSTLDNILGGLQLAGDIGMLKLATKTPSGSFNAEPDPATRIQYPAEFESRNTRVKEAWEKEKLKKSGVSTSADEYRKFLQDQEAQKQLIYKRNELKKLIENRNREVGNIKRLAQHGEMPNPGMIMNENDYAFIKDLFPEFDIKGTSDYNFFKNSPSKPLFDLRNGMFDSKLTFQSPLKVPSETLLPIRDLLKMSNYSGKQAFGDIRSLRLNEYGGPLVDYYKGKMTGPNIFADGGPSDNGKKPSGDARIPLFANPLNISYQTFDKGYDFLSNIFSFGKSEEPVAEVSTTLPNDLLLRQAFAESSFNALAHKNDSHPYKGLTQLGEAAVADYIKATGDKNVDRFNPQHAVKVQRFMMNRLYNDPVINKPNQLDDVRRAKTLAAYNWGKQHLVNYLNEKKKQGMDIYKSMDWVKDLPVETSDYIGKILLNKNIGNYAEDFKKSIVNPKFKSIVSLYKEMGGQSNEGYYNYNYNVPEFKDGGPGPKNRKLNNDELKALAHQFRGRSEEDINKGIYTSDYTTDHSERIEDPSFFGGFKWLPSYDTHGRLTSDEINQLKNFMNSEGVLQKAWEYLPNISRGKGQASLPNNSSLRNRGMAYGGSTRMNEFGYLVDKLAGGGEWHHGYYDKEGGLVKYQDKGQVAFPYLIPQSSYRPNPFIDQDWTTRQTESTDAATNFLKNWYEKRQTLPQFKDVSERRLKALNDPLNINYIDMAEMRRRGDAAAYDPYTKEIDLIDTKNIKYNPGYPDYNNEADINEQIAVSTGVPVIGHELFHRLQYQAPQAGLRTMNFSNPLDKFEKPSKTGLSKARYSYFSEPQVITAKTLKDIPYPMHKKGQGAAFNPEMEAGVAMLRMAENMDPLKTYTVQDVQQMVDKYKNYNHKDTLKSQTTDEFGEKHSGWFINSMFKMLGNDPKKIAKFINSVAVNTPEQSNEARYGGLVKYQSMGKASHGGDISIPQLPDLQGPLLQYYYSKGGLTPNKAREILHDKGVHGHPLTEKQRRFFGAMSKGNTKRY